MVALSLLGDSYLYAVLPIYYAEAGISLLAVGWLLSVNRWIRFLSNPAAGTIGGRLGWGWAFAGAMWLAALTTGAYGLLTATWALSAARGLWGVSWSFLRLGGLAAVLADSPPGHRGKAMGLFTGIFRLGSFAGVLAGGLLADQMGFAGASLLLAGLTGAGALIASLPPAVGGQWGAPNRTPESSPQPGLFGNWLPGTAAQWRLCLGSFGLQLAVSGVVTGTIGLLVKQRLGAQVDLGWWVVGPSTAAGLILGSRFVTDLLIGPFIGQMADRRGRSWILGALVAVSIAALLGLAWSDGLAAIGVSALLLFLAGTGLATLLDSWAGDLAGLAPGRFLPVYNTWQDLGAALGPVLAYSLTSRIGLAGTYTAVAVAGAAMVLALRQSALAGRHQGGEPPVQGMER